MFEISVIIPIYNAEKYLIKCLESVLKQTFANYEIICIDDGSTDGSAAIIEMYAKRYNFIKNISHTKNRGLSAARNTGIKNAVGKYVFFLDADDMIIPDTLEELHECAEKNELDIIYFNMKKIYEDEVKQIQDVREKVYCDYKGVYSGEEMFCLFANEQNMKIEAWRQFYKRDFLMKNKILFYEGILHEDNLFSFLSAMKAKRVMNINKEYYIYRQHVGSIMSVINEHRMKSIYIVLLEIFKYWDSYTFSDFTNRAISYYFGDLLSRFFYYKDICQSDVGLETGSYAEKFLYEIIMGKHKQKRYATLSQNKINRLREAEYIIVFGAGRAANDVVQILQSENVNIDAIAVSNIKVVDKSYCGIKTMEIKELLQYKAIAMIIIGVTEKYCKEVKEQLTSMGFKYLMLIDECEDV